MKLHILGVVMLLAVGIGYGMAQPKHKSKNDSHITGHVIDAATGEHIPYVTIEIKGSTVATLSDASGHFLLRHVEEGRHTLVLSFAGYKTIEKEVDVEANKTIEVKFDMESQIIDVDQIVVTGSRNATTKRASSTIVNVVSSKLFERSAANNVAEVLNFQPGLRVEYNCSNCGVPQLRINGLEGQYSQILLDNRPIFSSLATVYGLEQLPASMIERVEVIRGGGSALFGSSAIGGVLNIITKEPVTNSLSVANNTSFFETGGADINTSLGGSFVTNDYRAGIYIFGMIKSRDKYDRDGDGFSEIPKVNSETIGFRGFYKISPSSRITAEYHHISEFRRGGNLLDLPPHQADIAEQLNHKIDGGGLKYDFTSKDTRHRLGIYTSIQNIDRNSYFGTHQNPNAYGTTKDFTFIAGAQYTYAINKFWFSPAQLTIGAEFSDNELRDEMLGYNRHLAQSSVCYGIYAQNEWQSEKFSLLIGGRLDKHSKIKNVIFSPRVNVRYTPIKEVGLRVSYSSGYRAPQAYEEDLHVAAVGGQVAIISVDPNLRPEYSQSVSGSVDFYKKFGKVEFNFLVEGFYTNLNDVFKLQEIGHDSAGNLLLERQNASGAIVAGANFELKVGLSPKWILDAGFTIQTSQYKEPEAWSENPNIVPQKKMFRTPDNYGYFALNYLPTSKISTSLSANYTGNMLVKHYAGYIDKDEQVLTNPFWDLAFRFAYDFTLSKSCKLQVSCGVKNMLDAFQSDIDQGVGRDSKYIYGPAMPRTYFVGLKFSI